MDRKHGTEATRPRDSVSVARPFARLRVIAFLVFLAIALVVLLVRWLLG